MNMKKILAASAASALAAAAMTAAVFAAGVTAVTFKDETGKAELSDSSKGAATRIVWNLADILPEGITPEEVYGVALNLDVDYDESQGMGGSFIFSAKGDRNWKGIDWSNEALFDADKKTLTRLDTAPFFNSTDISGAEGEYAQVVIDAYWGSGTLTVKSIDFLAQDGSVLTANSGGDTTTSGDDNTGSETTAPAPAATTTGSGNTGNTGSTGGTGSTGSAGGSNKPNAGTGVGGVAAAAGIAVLAAGGVALAKKRK